MRRFGKKDDDFESVREFGNTMRALAAGPAPAHGYETVAAYTLRRTIEEVTRPISEIQRARKLAQFAPAVPIQAVQAMELTSAEIAMPPVNTQVLDTMMKYLD